MGLWEAPLWKTRGVDAFEGSDGSGGQEHAFHVEPRGSAAHRAVDAGSYNPRVPASRAHQWRFVVAAPPREVFAVMEQMIGTPPFRFEVLGESSARIVEFQRNSLVGHWRRVDGGGRGAGRERQPSRNQRWVTCSAVMEDAGTVIEMEASKGRGTLPRALQLIGVLSRGAHDPRTIYRTRRIPPGPVSLVASWAGMGYALYDAPERAAPRGTAVFTATRMAAIPGGTAEFVKVRLSDGTEGYVERDQVVSAPDRATREAGLEAARNV
jgi:hypothetical protein